MSNGSISCTFKDPKKRLLLQLLRHHSQLCHMFLSQGLDDFFLIDNFIQIHITKEPLIEE
jgi:hypothetical protein